MNPDYEPALRTEPATAEPEAKAPDWNELKLALNNAVWMHAPASTTPAEAEEATCRALSYLAAILPRNDSAAHAKSPTCGALKWLMLFAWCGSRTAAASRTKNHHATNRRRKHFRDAPRTR